MSLALLLEPFPVAAIVMRHDRDEQAFKDLARKFPATVTLHTSSNRAVLTGMGTLIHPRWVVTAAHVTDDLAPGDLANVGGATYEIEAIIKHPDWRGATSWENLRKDIAMLRLRTAVAGVAPVNLYTGSDEAGMSVTFVGMGSFGTGLTGPVAETPTMRAATNRVEKTDGSFLQFRFDAPGDPGTTPLEGISGEGDSGGPAYIERDGIVYLIGVGSAQDSRPAGKKIGHYGVLEYYPRVSYFAEWIQATVSE
ncbi:MAG TPA: trypsin-like serine protease [Vicinamibacterales bacterium]|nr:trypsin-like serine protease [Vicinamibacterales bacterium]